jgi:hypothetical protein
VLLSIKFEASRLPRLIPLPEVGLEVEGCTLGSSHNPDYNTPFKISQIFPMFTLGRFSVSRKYLSSTKSSCSVHVKAPVSIWQGLRVIALSDCHESTSDLVMIMNNISIHGFDQGDRSAGEIDVRVTFK